MIRPGDERYYAARALWNASADRRPALIASPRNSHEVATAVLHARDASGPGEPPRYVDSWPGVVIEGAMAWSSQRTDSSATNPNWGQSASTDLRP